MNSITHREKPRTQNSTRYLSNFDTSNHFYSQCNIQLAGSTQTAGRHLRIQALKPFITKTSKTQIIAKTNTCLPHNVDMLFKHARIILLLKSVRWWAWEDLNFRPHAYQARALTN
jgi:hypothetical protein